MARKRVPLTEEGTQATLGAGGILDRIGDQVAGLEVRELPIAQIQPNPFQPRRHFAQESVEELARSIREHGFYGHLLVRKQSRRYELAYGERRLRAAQLAGLEAIPAQIRELSDHQMLEIALTENVLREDLNPVEEARGYLRLQEEMKYSVRQIAERIGKSKSYVGTLLSILRYPDLEEAVRSADIPVRTAEELAKFKDAEERRFYIGQVVAGKMEREQLIAARHKRASPSSVRSADKKQDVTEAINRIFRTLERQQIHQVQPTAREETVRLLRGIIEQANQLLANLEQEK